VEGRGGKRVDLEVIYNLFDFENYIITITV
jgi:hypothetical protein